MENKILQYYCQNGAYHEYDCCITCWNSHPEAQKYENKSWNKEFKETIAIKKRNEKLEKLRNSGFSKKQSELLLELFI